MLQRTGRAGSAVDVRLFIGAKAYCIRDLFRRDKFNATVVIQVKPVPPQ